MSVTTHPPKKEAWSFATLAVATFGTFACHAETAPAGPAGSQSEIPPPATASPAVAAGTTPDQGYRCTLVLGLAVTSEWYRAGFESLVEDDRWEAITKPHTFVEHWADPENAVWRELPQSPCAERWKDPDRVLFFAANFKFTAQAEWDKALGDVVVVLRQKYPGARRIELLSMVRAPQNNSCGSEKGVVNPIIDVSISATSARYPELVVAGPRFEARSCDDLEKGGPHFTKAGGAAVAKLIADHYSR